jgi:hypothetical protein
MKLVLLILVCYSKAFLSSFLIPQNHWDAPEFQFHHQKQEPGKSSFKMLRKQLKYSTGWEIFNRLQKDAELNLEETFVTKQVTILVCCMEIKIQTKNDNIFDS